MFFDTNSALSILLNRLKPFMMTLDRSFISGNWQKSRGQKSFEIINPATEARLGSVHASSFEDAEDAVAAARAAFSDWSIKPAFERAELIDRIFDALSRRSEDIAQSITREVGSTIGLSRGVQAGAAISKFSYYADHVRNFSFESAFGATPVLKEPIGVVLCITPWNFPLLQIAAKVAPALAAGCTVILKPSELAPTNAMILAECIEDAGLPAGVFNLVWGEGSSLGEHLVGHAEIDMISFTGSTSAGRRIAAVAGQMIKRTSMELGGKSAAIVLDDANLETAISGVLETCFVNSGQSCTAHSRLIVPANMLSAAEDVAKTLAEAWTLGDPADEATRMGPVISRAHRARVQAYIQAGIDAPHTKLITGGPGTPGAFQTGFFVQPTVFSKVQADDTVAQEEIFGPVLSILSAETEQEAINIANNSIYGLSGGVWSADQDRAIAIAKRLRTGTVEINGGTFNRDAPFGGYKQSGLGREMGPYGFHEFLELKTLQV